MAAAAAAAGAPAAGPPPNQADVDAVFTRLNNISTSIRGSNAHIQQFQNFRAQLQTRLGIILARIQQITIAAATLSTARRDLDTLRRRLIDANVPSEADLHALQDLINHLDPGTLTAGLDNLRDEVMALEQSVGLSTANPPGPLQAPPAGTPMWGHPHQAGGYKSSARARTARAKRLTTRKRLHSRPHTRKHRRRKHHRRRRRKHKKGTRHGRHPHHRR